MRKRIIIGLIAAVVIGAVAIVVTKPKEGSLKWHIRQYRVTADRLEKGTWKVRAQNVLRRMLGKRKYFIFASATDMERLAEHQEALISFGYLEKLEVVFSNRTADAVLLGRDFESVRTNLFKDPRLKRTEWEFVDLIPTKGEYGIAIVARGQDMPVLEETLRRADVPENWK